MERRTSERKPIHLEAELNWQDQASWACSIEDFCAEGMFIRFEVGLRDQIRFVYSQQTNNALNIRFSINDKNYEVLVKPVRMLDSAIGVMFLQSHPEVFAAMLRECARDTAQAEVVTENSKAAFVVRQFGRALTQHTQPLLMAFFDGVGEKLKEAAEHAPTDRVANGIKDSASLVHRSRRIIQANMLDYLTSPAKIPTPQNQTETSLSLIEKNEFEEWLSVKVMITKAETLYRGPLLQLKMRLDKVGVVNATGYQNPYGPALICYAFKAASDPLKLLKQAEKTYYKSFEIDVLQHLEALYIELNQILVRQGILPDLDLSKYLSSKKKTEKPESSRPDEAEATDSNDGPEEVEKRISAASFQRRSDNHSPVNASDVSPGFTPSHVSSSEREEGLSPQVSPETPAGPDPHNDQTQRGAAIDRRPENHGVSGSSGSAYHQAMSPPFSELASTQRGGGGFGSASVQASASFDTVQNLFDVLDKTKRGLPLHSDAPEVDKPKWSPVELQKSLQRLQQLTARGELSADLGSTLTEQVQHELVAEHPEEEKVLPRQQEQTFDVVDQFFASMVENEKISDHVKQQVGKLQVPVVKLLLKDKQLLEKADSPVRALLNRIGQLGLKGGRPSPAVQQKIDAVIQRINEEFVDDPDVFEEGVEELDGVIERQNQLYRRNVERVMSAAEGAQKIDLAKNRVREELENRIAGKEIPRAVVSLINGGWRDLLSLIYIRQGDQSDSWYKYLNVVDVLLSYSQNPESDLDLPVLLKTIQDGLTMISSNHMPSGHIRDELKQFIVGAKQRSQETIAMPARSAESETDLSQSPEARSKSLRRWVQRAQKLEVGCWIKHVMKNKDPTFMRLVWIGQGYAKYVFVNHQGMKVIELDIIKLAGMMSRGSLMLLPDYEKPIVDESLDNIVKQVYERLSYAATHDPITGLINRNELKRRIERALSRRGKSGQCSLIYLDLRQFKIVNDNAGYDAGDKLLKDIAGILRTYTPKLATVARVAGNEFAVLINNPNIEALGKRYIEAVKDHVIEWDGQDYKVSANVGLVVSNEYLTNTEKLLGAAESACKKAKQLGPNRLYVSDDDSGNPSQKDEILAKVARFEDLSDERVLLRCQKILPLHLNCKLSAHHEILLSVYDDRGHLISAGEFIRTAEFYNRMQTVDRWVVGRMLDWMADNQESLKNLGGVSINLSGHSLNDETLLEFVYDKLSKRDSPMDKICFEITDASAITNITDVADFVRELKETGCHFSLGNFGGGAVSHNLLKQIPVDLIKIDGSFIQDIANNSNDQAMVKSMTEMAHMMGKEVIACMVEDKASLEFLKPLGVDYAQGYGIEKPRLISSID